MCDFSGNFYNYSEWDHIKLDEMIILYLYFPCRDCEKFAVIQDVYTYPKFYKKVFELLNYEKEKENILTKIVKDKSLYKNVKATVATHK